MYEFLTKKGEMLAFGLGALLVAIFLFTVFPGLDDFNALPEDMRNTSSLFDLGLAIALILVVITVLAALFFALYQAVTNPAGSKMVALALVLLGGLFAVFYFTAGADTGVVAEAVEEFSVGATASKMISAAISTGGVLAIGSVVAFIALELWNAFK